MSFCTFIWEYIRVHCITGNTIWWLYNRGYLPRPSMIWYGGIEVAWWLWRHTPRPPSPSLPNPLCLLARNQSEPSSLLIVILGKTNWGGLKVNPLCNTRRRKTRGAKYENWPLPTFNHHHQDTSASSCFSDCLGHVTRCQSAPSLGWLSMIYLFMSPMSFRPATILIES